jgi:integrase
VNAWLKRWKVGCTNKTVARQHEAIIKAQLMEGQVIVPAAPQIPVTVREYAARWLKQAEVTLAPKTHKNYGQLLSLYILPVIGEQDITSLTWGNIRSLLTEKQRMGLSANTVRLIRAVVSTILTDAVEEELIPNNPVLGQRRKRRASQVANAEVYPLNWDQKDLFERKLSEMESCQLLAPAYAMLLRVYLKAGLRPGEGRALKAGDIDFQRRRLRIERAATLERQVKNTKTGETRWVDLSDGLVKDLDNYRTLRTAEDVAQGKESEWLFPSLRGTLLDESHVIRAFHRVLDAAGLPRFRVYDLRHTFASLLLSANVPLLYVSQQLGHTKPTITLRYYARWIPSGQVHRVNVLDASNTSVTPTHHADQVAAISPA